MKILHVIPSVSDVHGGPSVAIRTIACALTNAGVEVHIATTDDDGDGHLRVPLGRPVRDGGTTYWYFPRQTAFYKFSWPLTHWIALRAGDYDVVHIHALFSYAAIPAAVSAARQHVPYVIRPLGTLNRWGLQNLHRSIKRISFPIVERNLIRHAALMHYTSEAERDEAAALGVERPHAVIPIGVAMAGRPRGRSSAWLDQRAAHLRGRRVVLFLSRLNPKKGLDLLLPAFARLKEQQPNTGLVIAGGGEGTYAADLRRQAAELGIAPDLYWAGHLSGTEKEGALAAADLFVLPSYSENFGIAVVEAMAAGLPVVISDQVGIYREVVEGNAGKVVPCHVDALADAMGQLAADPELCAAMGGDARRLAEQRYSIDTMASQLKRVYGELSQRPRGSAR